MEKKKKISCNEKNNFPVSNIWNILLAKIKFMFSSYCQRRLDLKRMTNIFF